MSTKYFVLFSALKSGANKGVSPEALMKAMGYNKGALAVYIHALRHKFGADIEVVREGRTIVLYKLKNAAELESKISPTRKKRTVTKKAATKPAKKLKVTKPRARTAAIASDDGSIPVIDDLSVTEITDADLDDIKNQLGIA